MESTERRRRRRAAAEEEDLLYFLVVLISESTKREKGTNIAGEGTENNEMLLLGCFRDLYHSIICTEIENVTELLSNRTTPKLGAWEAQPCWA